MYGAMMGDIIGSVYEWHNVKTEDFPLFSRGSHFTDDTVLTAAVMAKLLSDKKQGRDTGRQGYAMHFKQFYRRYPNAGFGQMFSQWALKAPTTVQKSYGNGASMRVSPIGRAFDNEKDVLIESAKSCYYTHINREAAVHAQAVALAVFLAARGAEKREIKAQLIRKTGIDLSFTLDGIRDGYKFDSRSKNSVPHGIIAFLESRDYESAVRKAVSIGGDSDTIACIAGGIAEAYYGKVPEEILSKGKNFLDGTIKDIAREFYTEFIK